jgi:hypothetical protein
MENTNKGGKRSGSGRKPKYTELSTTVSIRVPASKKEYYKNSFNSFVEINEQKFVTK